MSSSFAWVGCSHRSVCWTDGRTNRQSDGFRLFGFAPHFCASVRWWRRLRRRLRTQSCIIRRSVIDIRRADSAAPSLSVLVPVIRSDELLARRLQRLHDCSSACVRACLRASSLSCSPGFGYPRCTGQTSMIKPTIVALFIPNRVASNGSVT